MEKRVGYWFYYKGHNKSETYKALCYKIEYHKGLNEYLYYGESPYGNKLRLTDSEILYWEYEKKKKL